MSTPDNERDDERKGNRLSKIVTRTGDAGTTGLGDGTRTTKDSLRIDAIGETDELNSTIGLLLCEELPEAIRTALLDIQHDLFDLGADLCRPEMAKDAEAGYPVLRMIASQVERLEAEIDAMNAPLAALRSFILPGGTPLAAYLHLCRTVSRRAERMTVELATMEEGGHQWLLGISARARHPPATARRGDTARPPPGP